MKFTKPIFSKHIVVPTLLKQFSWKSFLCCILLLCWQFSISAQKPAVAIKIGGSLEDNAYKSTTDKDGNIIVVGRFFGTADFDPGPSVFNLTSNGSNDFFVAKYASSGSFIWAFRVGGSDRDAAYSVVTDNQRNVYVSGYFRGTVDFDPGPGIRNVVSNGETGGDPGWSGEIFLAKYDANGQYQWAFGIGGSTKSDDGQDLVIDYNNNLIIGGFFFGNNVDFDPGTSSFLLSSSSASEDLFLAKYTTDGSLVWARKMGGDVPRNEAVRKVAVDNANNIYITGFFGGTADFGTSYNTAVLNASSMFEGFVAKYTSGGNYVWANQFGGSGFNQGWGIEVDTVNRYVYVTGGVQGGSINFSSPSSVVTVPGNGGSDIFFAKYDLNGNLSYAKVMGGPGNESGYSLTVNPLANSLYITGYFEQTCDFDPSLASSLISSRGALDIFVSRYQLDGTFSCAFNIGSPANDYAFDIKSNESAVYVTGSFTGSQTDFDPGASTAFLSADGDYDGFVVKYDWSSSAAPTGLLSGNTICRGEAGKLLFSALSGTPPFTLTISDGLSTFVQKNVLDKVPFDVPATPTTSTVYKIVSISDETFCHTINTLSNDTALITVNQPLAIKTIGDSAMCSGSSMRLKTSGGTTYQWTPATGLDADNVASPLCTTLVSTTYKVVVTTSAGCSDSATTRVTIKSKPTATVTNAATICSGDSVRLSASGGTIYQWLPAVGLSAANIPNPWAYPTSSTNYTIVVSNDEGCSDTTKTDVAVKQQPVLHLSDQIVCEGNSAMFDATQNGAISYLWSNGSTSSAITAANEGRYSVAVQFAGCNNPVRDTVELTVSPAPTVSLGKDTTICKSETLRLVADGKNIERYLWNTGSTTPYIDVTTDGEYAIRVANSCGEAAASMHVKVEICSNDIYFPNAFTPNRDGVNDFFKAAYLNGISVTNYELAVYNRWGQVVFRTTNLSKGWDGTYGGKLQPGEVFVWQAHYSLDGNKTLRSKKGTVVLIR